MKSILTPIENAMYGSMEDSNRHASKVCEEMSQAGRAYEHHMGAYNEMRKDYMRDLRNVVVKKCLRIVKKHSNSWFANVEVLPLHDHTTHISSTLMKISWEGKCGKFTVQGMVPTPDHVEQLIARFQRTLIAIQDT